MFVPFKEKLISVLSFGENKIGAIANINTKTPVIINIPGFKNILNNSPLKILKIFIIHLVY